MGAFYTSVHVKITDPNKVAQAVESFQVLPVFVTDCVNGWVSVYPRQTESQDDEILRRVTKDLSSALQTGVFGFLVHDSDVFMYTFFEGGQQLDNYCSDPGYFSGADMPPQGGNIEALLRYCQPGTTSEKLKKTIFQKPNKAMAAAKVGMAILRKDVAGMMNSGMIWAGDSLAQALAEVLGIQPDRANIGYKYIKSGDTATDTSSFLHIKDGSAEDDLKVFQIVAGEPRLLTKHDKDLESVSPEHRAKAEEMLHAMGEHRHLQDNSGHVGEEIRILEQLANAGGTASGAALTVRGTAIEQGLVIPRFHITVSYSSDEDNDFEEPDPADERLWPYDFALVQTGDGEYSGNAAAFPLVREFELEIILKAVQPGRGSLAIELHPHDRSGSSKIHLDYQIFVLPENSQPIPEAHEVNFSGYSIMVPEGFESAESGFGIQCQHTRLANTEFNISAINPQALENHPLAALLKDAFKNQTAASIAELLEAKRIELKSREWQTLDLEPIVIEGVLFQRAMWQSGTKNLWGAIRLGRDGENQIEISAQTEERETLQEMDEAADTFRRNNLPAGAPSGTTARRQSHTTTGITTKATEKAPFKLKVLILLVKMAVLSAVFAFVLPRVKGVKVEIVPAILAGFVFYFAIVWPIAARIIIALVAVALPPVKPILRNLAAQSGKPNFVILQTPLGFLSISLGLYIYTLISPASLAIKTPVAFAIVTLIMLAINLLNLALQEALIRRQYSGEKAYVVLPWSQAIKTNCFEAAVRLQCGQSLSEVMEVTNIPLPSLKEIAAVSQFENGETDNEFARELNLSAQNLVALRQQYRQAKAETLFIKHRGDLNAQEQAFVKNWSKTETSGSSTEGESAEAETFAELEQWLDQAILGEHSNVLVAMKKEAAGSPELIEKAQSQLTQMQNIIKRFD